MFAKLTRYLLVSLLCAELAPLPAQPARAASAAGIAWMPYHLGLAEAKSQHKHALIDFYATWCTYCKKMEREVFTDPRVRQVLNQYFVPIRLTEKSQSKVLYQGRWTTEAKVLDAYDIEGFPSLLFLDSAGKRIHLLPGYLEADDMYAMLSFIGTDSYTRMNFRAYKAQLLHSSK